MASIRPLRNPPITEALIDFRVSTREGFRAEEFLSLKDRLHREFPIADEQRWSEARIEFRQGPPTLLGADLGLRGVLFRSADKLNVAQFRVDGFTFNRLKPYTAWEAIRPEAQRLWELYVETARPENIVRLALRYINHLLLPTNLGGLARFLTAPPLLPSRYPPQLRGYLSRLVVGKPQSETAANVIQAVENPQQDSLTALIDIDVYMQQELPCQDRRLTELLEELRIVKNEIFFDTVTEVALRLYE